MNQKCVDKAWLKQKLGRGWLVEQCKCCTARRTDVAVVGYTHKRKFAATGLRIDADCVAQYKLAIFCRGLIENYFGWPNRKAAFLDIPQPHHVGCSNATECWRTIVGAKWRAVFANDSGKALDITNGIFDSWHCKHGFERLDWRARALFATKINFNET